MLQDPVRKKNQQAANKNYWENVDEETLKFKREVAMRSLHTKEAREKATASLRRHWENATDEYRAMHGEAISAAIRAVPDLGDRLHKSILKGDKVSAGQRQVFNFVRTICDDAILEYPMDRYLFDIFIPSKNLAIEFNGWYWHSDKANRHEITYEKYLMCERVGIRLLVIWDFDWAQKRSIIEDRLRAILGVSGSRLFARKCKVVDGFSSRIKSDFLNLHHLQGDDKAFYWCGLFYEGACVSIMTFRKSRNNRSIELSRFCGSVVGGFSKLLKFALEKLQISEVFSFSDNSYSDGGLYRDNGWELVSELAPDYRVVYDGRCYHKSAFTKSNIKKRFPQVYDECLTEFQMEDLIPAYRIWDCGKKKWRYVV